LPSYADSSIVSLELTREALLRHRTGIESGSVWGPPALQVMLPHITFEDRLDLHLKNLKVELHRFEIHSRDGNLMYIPDDRVLFAGDALEDTLTYVEEPDGISTHLAELDRLRAMDIDAVYPNHGDFQIISAGGYPKALIDAVAEYDANMLTRVHDADYLEMPIEDFIPDALAAGVVTVWEPYRAVHARNLRLVSGCKDSTVR
jgi:glyoxylase-like metal-dependent hydrolase (beta-lactamase superfamily II)